MQIFPNPTNNTLLFRNIPENSAIVIIDLYGKRPKRMKSNCNELLVDISDMKKGLYMIKTFSQDYFLSELLIKE